MRKTFTLIELLIVVSIIIILMSMLLPALGKAREKGRTILCAKNAATLGQCLNMYADDNNGYYMRNCAESNYNHGWYHPSASTFPSYYGNKSYYDMFKVNIVTDCPSREVGYGASIGLHIDYGYNYEMSLKKISGIANPTQKITFFDSNLYFCSTNSASSWYWQSGILPLVHNSGFNAVFADGHVKWNRPSQIQDSNFLPYQ